MNMMTPYEEMSADLKAVKFDDQSACNTAYAAVGKSFREWRAERLRTMDVAIAEWNGAVAAAVEQVGRMDSLSARTMGDNWHAQIAKALRAMDRPMHSDVILEVARPFGKNDVLEGRVRAFGVTMMAEDPEFMPSTQLDWPRFPYFLVQPGTLRSLSQEGLILLSNPPASMKKSPITWALRSSAAAMVDLPW